MQFNDNLLQIAKAKEDVPFKEVLAIKSLDFLILFVQSAGNSNSNAYYL